METGPSSISRNTSKTNTLVKEYGELLPGTLFSINEKQYAAIKKVHEIGEQIAKNYGEKICTLRTSGSTNVQIAKKVIPEIYEKYPIVAEVAISYALGILLGEDRKKVTKEILSKLAKKKSNLKRLKKIAASGMKARIAKYGEKEVAKQRKEGGNKLAELQGKVVISEEEKKIIIDLCNNKEYKNELGQIKRQEIAKIINNEFRGGKIVRNGTAIADCFRRYGKKK